MGISEALRILDKRCDDLVAGIALLALKPAALKDASGKIKDPDVETFRSSTILLVKNCTREAEGEIAAIKVVAIAQQSKVLLQPRLLVDLYKRCDALQALCDKATRIAEKYEAEAKMFEKDAEGLTETERKIRRFDSYMNRDIVEESGKELTPMERAIVNERKRLGRVGPRRPLGDILDEMIKAQQKGE